MFIPKTKYIKSLPACLGDLVLQIYPTHIFFLKEGTEKAAEQTVIIVKILEEVDVNSQI